MHFETKCPATRDYSRPARSVVIYNRFLLEFGFRKNLIIELNRLSAIKKREKGLFTQGFNKIIGLRDMYSQTYREISPGAIDNTLMQQFIDSANNSIAMMSHPDQIHFHFAIMELEAWWLCMYTLFTKIDNRLTVDFIAEKLGYNLSVIDAEKTFFHPALKVTEILNLVELSYDKHFSEVESITSHITFDDIVEVIMRNDGWCESFKRFCDNLSSY